MENGALRRAVPGDTEELIRLEHLCFQTDRLSRRSFQRWLRHEDCVFLVSDAGEGLAGYILVIRRRGTRLARIYSLAVDPALRGRGTARSLVEEAERCARSRGAIYMRLEVAESNRAAIALYRKLGYESFGCYQDYYDDHANAVRMEKCIHTFQSSATERLIPWLPQSTDFTCGPASLMMAMAGLDDAYKPSVAEEIQIWREATTIFMTSGPGGSHPLGLALAAVRRSFRAEVWLNQRGPLFLDGVRAHNKKQVMTLAHEGFIEEASRLGVGISYGEVSQQYLADRFAAGDNVLVLISTYRLDRKKAPHWVVLSGFDDDCLYVNDPDLESSRQGSPVSGAGLALDCQHLPIPRDSFDAMSRYGVSRLRTAVVLGPPVS